MNKLTTEKRAQALGLMVEGVSLRAITRLTGIHRTTLLNLLVSAGHAFTDYQARTLVGLTCKRIQVDEIWAFVGCKEKNATPEQKAAGMGDVWTWTAIDADTKLAVSWFVGDRSGETAKVFMADIAGRLANRVQLTSDGHKAYLEAVEAAFGADIDYAQLIKLYGDVPDSAKGRYSPADCTGIEKRPITGKPDRKHISTSFVERQNLTMRMSIRRFTRLTNAFSKKVENHAHSVALHFMHYNFVRLHQTLRVTPAMQAGVTKTLWSLMDMARVIEAWEVQASDSPSI